MTYFYLIWFASMQTIVYIDDTGGVKKTLCFKMGLLGKIKSTC